MTDPDAIFPLDGPECPPVSGAAPGQLVVMLHGVGSCGAHMIELVGPLAAALPDAHFIAPNGIAPCDFSPEYFQWCSIHPPTPEGRAAQIESARRSVDGLIGDRRREFGLDANRVALVGFSQGTMLSMQCGLRRADPIAGVLGFSGRMEFVDTMAQKITSRPPVCLIHGKDDDVLPLAMMEEALQVLRDNDIPVEATVLPNLGHGVNQQGLDLGAAFLARVFQR